VLTPGWLAATIRFPEKWNPAESLSRDTNHGNQACKRPGAAESAHTQLFIDTNGLTVDGGSLIRSIRQPEGDCQVAAVGRLMSIVL